MHKKADFFSFLHNIHTKALFVAIFVFIKKYWGILTPILIVIFAFSLRMVERSEQLPELFQYVPADAQQVVVNRPARNIGNTQDVSLTQIPAGVKAQFQQISLMLMVQI